MLKWFRVRASAIAMAAIVAMAVVGGSAVVPHDDDCHDAACALAGDRSAAATRISAPAVDDEGHPLHCLVCHWVRAFRPNAEARIVSAPATNAATRVHVEIRTVSGRAPVAQPPLRSPPSPSAA
jgi:hypothetical protein